MNNEEDLLRIALKQEMELAHSRFTIVYKKISEGLTRIYTQAMLTNELIEVKKLHSKFFGFIKKSKNAKDKFGEED
jgi:hypothetical protein